MHCAAANNHSKVVRILLENGCDINVKDNVRHVDVNVNDNICNYCIVNFGVHGVSTALATSLASKLGLHVLSVLFHAKIAMGRDVVLPSVEATTIQGSSQAC